MPHQRGMRDERGQPDRDDRAQTRYHFVTVTADDRDLAGLSGMELWDLGVSECEAHPGASRRLRRGRRPQGASWPPAPRSSVLDTCVTRDASVSGRQGAESRPLPVRTTTTQDAGRIRSASSASRPGTGSIRVQRPSTSYRGAPTHDNGRIRYRPLPAPYSSRSGCP